MLHDERSMPVASPRCASIQLGPSKVCVGDLFELHELVDCRGPDRDPGSLAITTDKSMMHQIQIGSRFRVYSQANMINAHLAALISN
jgi:hypothetical protein